MFKMKEKMLVIILAVLLAVLILGFFITKTITTNAVKENNAKFDWLKDNCNCIERDNLKCPEGFVLEPDAKLCKKGIDITNVLLGCSKYDCNEEIYLLVNGKWEKQ